MGNCKRKKDLESLKNAPTLYIATRLTGSMKTKFIQSIERGENTSEVLREIIKSHYSTNKDSDRY